VYPIAIVLLLLSSDHCFYAIMLENCGFFNCFSTLLKYTSKNDPQPYPPRLMSRNYLPRAAAGSLLLAGAASLLDGADTPTNASSTRIGGSETSSHAMDIDSDGSYEGRSTIKALGSTFARPRPQSWEDEEENDAGDIDMSSEDHELFFGQLTRCSQVLDTLCSIPRAVLHHPDEQLRIRYWEVERSIVEQWESVEDDSVDMNTLFLLVGLANECFEVARESYVVSAAANETNWFEQSLTWNNRRFRRIYR
jgi:hypothetical protein